MPTENNMQNESFEPKKTRRTWLWVLGWIFCFPIPLTIILLRKKDMKPVLRYGLIVAAWLFVIIIAVAGNSDSDETGTRSIPETTGKSSSITALIFANTDDVVLKTGEKKATTYSFSEYVSVEKNSYASISPEDIVFVSENPDVATITLTEISYPSRIYYEITAVGPGETYVYVRTPDESVVSEKIKVTVPKPVLAESIAIGEVQSEMALGDKTQLSAEIKPDDAENKTVSWSSSNEEVLQVDEKGMITAVGGGEAVITASTDNGITASAEFTVDASKRTMALRVSHSQKNDVNIGHEWSFETEVNGERAGRTCTVAAGETLKLYAKITESDDNPDIGKASKSYTVKEEDLLNGFEVSMDIYVTENGGRNSGKSAHFVVTYTFSPQE